jgi:hypothetical protein
MDIYEFTQTLWRRKWLLLSGFTLLIAFVVAVSFDFSDGVKLRTTPKYQAAVRMAVVPEGYESLGQDLGSNSLNGTAQVFASLLSSPQAALEISQERGVRLLDFGVRTTGRDRFLTATALSDTPEGAVSGALGAFYWLEQRLTDDLITASAPSTPAPEPEVLDADGQFRGTVRLGADHSLAADSEGLWIVTRVRSGTDFAYRLADAALEPSAEYPAVLKPGEEMAIRLEDASGKAIDEVAVVVPPIPTGGSSSYELHMAFDRGLLRGTLKNPQLDAAFVTVSWLPIGQGIVSEGVEASEVSLLLLSDTPVPVHIGGRKAPMIIIALLTAGVIALLVTAVVVDSWSRERQRQREARTGMPGPSQITPTMEDVDEILHRVSS